METAYAQLWWPWLLVCTSVATGSHHGGKSSSGGCDKHQASGAQAPCWKGWRQVWAWWRGSAVGVQAGISHRDRRLCVRVLGPGRGREEATGKDSGWVPADALPGAQNLVKSAGGAQCPWCPLVYSEAKVPRVLSRADPWDPQLFPFQG